MQKRKIKVPVKKPRNPLVVIVMQKATKKHRNRKKESKYVCEFFFD